MDSSWCANCGLEIYYEGVIWIANKSKINTVSDFDDPELYFDFCCGSRENLEKYPTFTDWNTQYQDKTYTGDHLSHAHRPVDVLVQLVIDVERRNHGMETTDPN